MVLSCERVWAGEGRESDIRIFESLGRSSVMKSSRSKWGTVWEVLAMYLNRARHFDEGVGDSERLAKRNRKTLKCLQN